MVSPSVYIFPFFAFSRDFQIIRARDGKSTYTLTNLGETSTYDELLSELSKLTQWSKENIRSKRSSIQCCKKEVAYYEI
jgi:hypothetical protein